MQLFKSSGYDGLSKVQVMANSYAITALDVHANSNKEEFATTFRVEVAEGHVVPPSTYFSFTLPVVGGKKFSLVSCFMIMPTQEDEDNGVTPKVHSLSASITSSPQKSTVHGNLIGMELSRNFEVACNLLGPDASYSANTRPFQNTFQLGSLSSGYFTIHLDSTYAAKSLLLTAPGTGTTAGFEVHLKSVTLDTSVDSVDQIVLSPSRNLQFYLLDNEKELKACVLKKGNTGETTQITLTEDGVVIFPVPPSFSFKKKDDVKLVCQKDSNIVLSKKIPGYPAILQVDFENQNMDTNAEDMAQSVSGTTLKRSYVRPRMGNSASSLMTNAGVVLFVASVLSYLF